MEELYKGQAGSPITYLSADISASQTTISVDDDSALPDAPNICTIGYGENLETIKYETKFNGVLQNVTRGVEGTPRAWQKGTEVARFFTAYDHNSIIESFNSHMAEIAKLAVFGLTANQSIATGGEYSKVAFNSTVRSADFVELLADGTIKILKNGLYTFTFFVDFTANTNGIRNLITPDYQTIVPAAASGNTRITITTQKRYSANDTLIFQVVQTSGVSLDITALLTKLSISRLGV